jgi:hypothetical protein
MQSHYKLFGGLQDVHKGANKPKYWWICKLSHPYVATVSSRVLKESGCPICANQKVLIGFNDLMSQFPSISQEWDFARNGDLVPKSLTYGSTTVARWICRKEGHSFKTKVHKRTGSEKSGCPYCSHQRLLSGFNDLATTHPEMALQRSRKDEALQPPPRKALHLICLSSPSMHAISSITLANGKLKTSCT